MAVVEVNSGRHGLQGAGLLRRWRWPALYVLLSVTAALLFPALQPVADKQALLGDASEWVLSAGVDADVSAAVVRWRSGAAGPFTASRAVALPAGTEFVGLRVCLDKAVADDGAALMLASVTAAGMLDFNRHYRLWGVSGSDPGACLEDALPRREGDGVAIVQVQLLVPGAELAVSELSVVPLRVSPVWRIAQPLLLVLGLALLVLPFRAYIDRRPRLFAAVGLLGVAAILFGCTVSVSLKADIYALLTGGRSAVISTQTLSELLLTVFPASGGFSIFTYMHALLFAGATLVLSLVYRYAWLDLLLLAPVTETLQLFVPGRGPGISDVLVDWEGVLLAWLLVAVLRRSQRVRLFLQQQGIDEDVTRL